MMGSRVLACSRDSAPIGTWRWETAEYFPKVQTKVGYMTEFNALRQVPESDIEKVSTLFRR